METINKGLCLLLFMIQFKHSYSSVFGRENDDEKRLLSLDNCSSYTDCYNCTLSTGICTWNLNRCLLSNKIVFTNRFWDKVYDTCLDQSSYDKQLKYCGNDAFSLGATIKLVNVNANGNSDFEEYGTKNMVCVWTATRILDTSIVNFNYTKLSPLGSDEISFQLFYYDGGQQINDLSNIFSRYSQDKNIKEIRIYYKSSGVMNTLPFTFEIKEVSKNLESYAGIFISVAIIVTVVIFFICIACFYKCNQSSIMLESERLQQRADRMNLLMQLDTIQLSNNNDNDLREQQNIIKENKKNLERMLKEFILPKSYSKVEYQTQTVCTICLDSFVDNDQILVLTCKHVFHQECLEHWLNQNILCPKCPNCNYLILDELKALKGEELNQLVSYWQFNNGEEENIYRNERMLNRVENIYIIGPGRGMVHSNEPNNRGENHIVVEIANQHQENFSESDRTINNEEDEQDNHEVRNTIGGVGVRLAIEDNHADVHVH